MAVDVVMPQMGESIFEGTITKWLKKPGDKVERDEPLFEISTDKVDAEIPSPSAGVLKEIKIPEGQTVPIQTVVAVIDGAGAAAAAPAPAAAPPAPAAKPAAAPAPSPAARNGSETCTSPAASSCYRPRGCLDRSTTSERRRCQHHGARAFFSAGSAARQGTQHRPHDARRNRRGRAHHQGRH